MIKIANNKVKCDITDKQENSKSAEQQRKFQEVIDSYKAAHKLFEEYQNLYGTDHTGIQQIIKIFNGGK